MVNICDFLLEEDAENAIFTPQICIILVYSLGNPVARGFDFLQMLHMQYCSRLPQMPNADTEGGITDKQAAEKAE